jgi:hypothetical protein
LNFVRLLPVVLSAFLLAAHFFRAGQETGVLIALALPLLLMLKRQWVPVVVSVALLLGALEWVHTLVNIAMMRSQMGVPWGRMALILGGVALFTAGSALVFRLKAIRIRYSVSRTGA